MILYDILNNCEPQPGALHIRTDIGRPIELIEDSRLISGRNPGSVIGNLQDHLILLGMDLNLNLAIHLRILDCIPDHVVEYLSEPDRVGT